MPGPSAFHVSDCNINSDSNYEEEIDESSKCCVCNWIVLPKALNLSSIYNKERNDQMDIYLALLLSFCNVLNIMAQMVHRRKPSGDVTRFYGSYGLEWKS